MNGHTADDLEKLLERMREERARVDEAGGQPFVVPPNGGAAQQNSADAQNNSAAAAANGTAQDGPAQSQAAPKSKPKPKPKPKREPEPSKMIFGRDLRHPDPAKYVEVPEHLRVDPNKVHIDALLIERVSDVPAFAVEWLWPGRIPLGRLTLLTGEPGICKSLVALDIAARVSTGAPWPDAPGQSREPACALVFSMEDDLHDTIKPRLMLAGADHQRTFVVEGIFNKPPYNDLRLTRRFRVQEDINSLRQALKELWPVRLVVFDPITAYCGNGDGVAMSVVHSMLAPLIQLAAECRVAILCTTHLRGSSRKAVYQAAGNLSFTTAARAVWGLVHDPRDKTRRLMVPVKMNLAPDTTGLAFRINPRGKLVWESEPVTLTADEALSEEREASKTKRATRWLREVLEAESRSSEWIMARGKVFGFSSSTIYRAAGALNVTMVQGGSGDAKCSIWSLRAGSVENLKI
jgi:hypothetical protein